MHWHQRLGKIYASANISSDSSRGFETEPKDGCGWDTYETNSLNLLVVTSDMPVEVSELVVVVPVRINYGECGHDGVQENEGTNSKLGSHWVVAAALL